MADGRIVPDNNEEYLLYQTLAGAWPLHMNSEEERREFVARVQQYMEKAMHEAKVNLSWLNSNPDYIAGVNSFIEKILAPSQRGKTNLFWDTFQKLLSQVLYFGCINSLSQTLLKLTSPGVPDIYQGEEMWNFNLVDPDNRRPVDFQQRARAAENSQPGGEGRTRIALPGAAARLSRRTDQVVGDDAGAKFPSRSQRTLSAVDVSAYMSHRAEKRSMSSPSRASIGREVSITVVPRLT